MNRSLRFLVAYKDSIILTSELVRNSWIFLIDQIGIIVLELEFIMHIRNEFQINETRLKKDFYFSSQPFKLL